MDARYDGWPTDGRQHRHFCSIPTCEAHYLCGQSDGCDNDTWTCPYHEQEQRDAHTEILMRQQAQTAQRSA